VVPESPRRTGFPRLRGNDRRRRTSLTPTAPHPRRYPDSAFPVSVTVALPQRATLHVMFSREARKRDVAGRIPYCVDLGGKAS